MKNVWIFIGWKWKNDGEVLHRVRKLKAAREYVRLESELSNKKSPTMNSILKCDVIKQKVIKEMNFADGVELKCLNRQQSN